MKVSLDKLLYEELPPNLTDFQNNQRVFHDVFVENASLGHPIKNILELGVCRMNPHFPDDYYGQSTKTLMALMLEFNSTRMISLDIDAEAEKTSDQCKRWLADRGWQVDSRHDFVCFNSIEYPVLEFPNGCDFIFLDTNHDDDYPSRLGIQGETGGAGMTYKEICYYADKLAPHGRMFLHDTKNFYVPRAYGVNTEGAIQRFLNENANFVFREHNTNEHGLGELVNVQADAYQKNKDRYVHRLKVE
jgi:hypothetical protein